jgi:hypothetical protein
MKQVTAFVCEHCKKIYRQKSRARDHEAVCFYNRESKSCITCKNLTSAPYVNGKKLTEQEEQILMFKVEGTYHVVRGNMECDYNELNEEYQYLNESEERTFCNYYQASLPKLTTKCNYHKSKV